MLCPCEIVSYSIFNINLCMFFISIKVGTQFFAPLFKPGTHVLVLGSNQTQSWVLCRPRSREWVLCSDLGLKRGSWFRLGTKVWVLCSDQELMHGTFVWTRDSSMCPLLKPDTGAWDLCFRCAVYFTSVVLCFSGFGELWAMLSIAYKLWAHVEHCLQTVGPC